MNYSKKFAQTSKAAATAKYRRLANHVGMSASSPAITIGFSTWWVGKDDNEENYDGNDYAIYVR